MPVLKDVVRCPSCGSREVVYTCEPKCCFNHVCADCRTSFQLVTRKLPERRNISTLQAEVPESGEPTAACAACESQRLVVVGGTESDSALLACADCGTCLALQYDEVAQA